MKIIFVSTEQNECIFLPIKKNKIYNLLIVFIFIRSIRYAGPYKQKPINFTAQKYAKQFKLLIIKIQITTNINPPNLSSYMPLTLYTTCGESIKTHRCIYSNLFNCLDLKIAAKQLRALTFFFSVSFTKPHYTHIARPSSLSVCVAAYCLLAYAILLFIFIYHCV